MFTLLITLSTLPIAIFTIWYFTSSIAATSLPAPNSLRNKRIILLIAHPDDEAMFFAPTLLALTQPALGNHLKILCLSNGDADGLGDTRAKELISSALTLGVRKREDVFVMNDARFQDGMQNHWRPEDICRVLGQAFAPQIVSSTSDPHDPSTKRKNKPGKPDRKPLLTPESPRATIDVLITFDAHGISHHPNHISLHHGAHLFLSHIMNSFPGHACPVTLYTLPTISLLRKYTFVLDALTTLISGIFDKSLLVSASVADTRVLFVNDLSKYRKARAAMVQGHTSQMRWFRWGWIGVGRYMVVNDLKKEKVKVLAPRKEDVVQ